MFPRVLIVFICYHSVCARRAAEAVERDTFARGAADTDRPPGGGGPAAAGCSQGVSNTHTHPCQTLEQAKHRSFLLILLCSFLF
jgi:hypothetical protein